MADFNPPTPPDYGPQQDFSGEMDHAGPAPMSGMAVAGFVLSLGSIIACCPVLFPFLGLIFSLIGYFQTGEGVRRGRGLSIAGLLISILLGVPASYLGLVGYKNVFAGPIKIAKAVGELDVGGVDAGAPLIYEMCSADFQAQITEEQLAGWLDERFQALGGLQDIINNAASGAKPTGVANQMQWGFPLKFPEKTVQLDFRITIETPSFAWLIDDIGLDGEFIVEQLGTATETPPTEPDEETTGGL